MEQTRKEDQHIPRSSVAQGEEVEGDQSIEQTGPAPWGDVDMGRGSVRNRFLWPIKCLCASGAPGVGRLRGWCPCAGHTPLLDCWPKLNWRPRVGAKWINLTTRKREQMNSEKQLAVIKSLGAAFSVS